MHSMRLVRCCGIDHRHRPKGAWSSTDAEPGEQIRCDLGEYIGWQCRLIEVRKDVCSKVPASEELGCEYVKLQAWSLAEVAASCACI